MSQGSVDELRARLLALRSRPFNFLSRQQSAAGSALAVDLLELLHADRRLPRFDEIAEIVTNPHAIGGFHDWCQRTRRFAIWTRESIATLAAYLRERRFERILEVGAGRGDLAWHLAQAGVAVRATDAGAATLAGFALPEYRDRPVEVWENVEERAWLAAVRESQPDCILCSWMPPDDDWTPEWRATRSVREYILFWELRGTTGGASAFQPQAGWKARDLLDVDDGLIGRTDEGLPNIGLTQYTRATAFRREQS